MGASLSFWTRRRRGPRRGSKVLHWPGDASGGWVLAHIHSQPAGCDSALPGAHLDALGQAGGQAPPSSTTDPGTMPSSSSWPWGTSMAVTYDPRSEEHTSELPSLMRISYAVFCLKKKSNRRNHTYKCTTHMPKRSRHTEK